MVIKCEHVWERIHDYIDGTLEGDMLVLIQRHLAQCEICFAVLDSTHNIVILTADERVFQLPPGFSERLHTRLDQELSRVGP